MCAASAGRSGSLWVVAPAENARRKINGQNWGGGKAWAATDAANRAIEQLDALSDLGFTKP